MMGVRDFFANESTRFFVSIFEPSSQTKISNGWGFCLKQNPQPFEILVCDDGSKIDTKNLVDSFAKKSRTPIIHVYQEDHGWDVSGIRNLGTLQSSGDYLVIIDGECVPHPSFIRDHMQAAETGCFVFGERSHVVKEHIDGFSTRP